MTKFTALFVLLLSFSGAYCINLKIKIYSGSNVNSFSIKTVSGSYKISNPNLHKKIDFNNKELKLIQENKKIKISYNDSVLGVFDSVKFIGTGLSNNFKIQIDVPNSPERIYDDNLIVKPGISGLHLFNEVDIEHYIAGVSESESGKKDNILEYYKVQAIICRTYALKNSGKHIKEGYNLCDQEHCQVYKGRCTNPEILLAVSKTTGIIIVDRYNQPINAAFHANCGGQTLNSEDVWSKPLDYLKSVPDTFCRNMSKAFWEKSIPKKDFLKYLNNHNIKDSVLIDSLLSFKQNNRKAFFYDTIKLKDLREYFALRSAFFSIIPQGDSLLFKGRGNGHGIGLCQQGAMNMASHGFSYMDIINHYYTNVHILNYNKKT